MSEETLTATLLLPMPGLPKAQDGWALGSSLLQELENVSVRCAPKQTTEMEALRMTTRKGFAHAAAHRDVTVVL